MNLVASVREHFLLRDTYSRSSGVPNKLQTKTLELGTSHSNVINKRALMLLVQSLLYAVLGVRFHSEVLVECPWAPLDTHHRCCSPQDTLLLVQPLLVPPSHGVVGMWM